jgi:co-chaperonin GroES (HSP10)
MTETEDKTLFDELPTLRTMTATEASTQDTEVKAKQLPDPSGYRILCAVPNVEEKYESGLFKADITKHYEELTTPVLFVLKVGPDAFKDTKRFPSGPWCKEGDFILTRPMAGTRVKIHGKEFRLINDDSVEAVIEDPRGVSRA